MKDLVIGKYRWKNFPTDWNDLSDDALLSVAENMQAGLSPSEIQLKALCRHFGWKVSTKKTVFDFINPCVYFVFEKGKDPVKVKAADVAYLCSEMDFLFKITWDEKEEDPTVQIDSRLNRNAISSFELDGITYHGPADCITNITFEEYCGAQTNFSRWIKKQDDEHLYKMIACLYRPGVPGLTKESKEYNGDLREPFVDGQVSIRADKLKHLDRKYINLILLFYQGCLQFIQLTFPETFPEEEPGQIKIKSIWKDPFVQFQKMTTKIAGGDVTKKPRVRRSLLFDVLFDMEEAIKDYKKWKSKNPQAPKV